MSPKAIDPEHTPIDTEGMPVAFISLKKVCLPCERLVLAEASKFQHIQCKRSPELQHEFCSLWNKIGNEVQDCNDRDTVWHSV